MVGLGLVEIQLHRSKLLERFHGCAHRLVPVPAIFLAGRSPTGTKNVDEIYRIFFDHRAHKPVPGWRRI